MGQRFLLDTNIFIYYLQSSIPTAGNNYLLSILLVESNISVLTKIELLGWLPPNRVEEDKIKNVVNSCTIFNLTDDIVDKAIELRHTYAKLALPDAIIAATALVHNLTLISRNDKDFQRIKKVKYTKPFNL